ncbi:murein hydrolase activator EnvC family protein [Fodinibius salsisoli]|uniref:M23 family metallopeptidase n=1 Tax=Fodinibius salsisoli TaxID=2820877 RepID=A0ABT3PN41_9BACT|nr:M23 family metallopeptidase [Fodinibius salsisoli]MCW9707377.1 M23 family metallopeptidase [Fodinibius salsisoli]
MFNFLKQLFSKQDRELTFVIFDEKEPDPSSNHRFKPAHLWYLFYGSLVTVAVIIFLLLKFSPVGELFSSHAERELQAQAIEISKRVQSLQDSLHARDAQLAQMKRVISTGADTVFTIDSSKGTTTSPAVQKKSELKSFSSVRSTSDSIFLKNKIVLSDIFKDVPDFPVGYPIKGTFTRGYNPQKGHFGIDIATKQGTPFTAIADGAVINLSWTLNYGWVLFVQHSDGIITVYKHAQSLSKSVGDVVQKGEVLGIAGDTGILSSGPHLHLEIWKNGIPQNPNSYLIKS